MLNDFRPDERDYSAQLVLDALSRGEPYSEWLLIFDDATRAEMIARYVPRGRGHVIITSRDSQWRRALGLEGIEVTEFEPSETVEFLRKRVGALTDLPSEPGSRENMRRLKDATELAEALDNLPVAADHAAAYLIETGIPAREYLTIFRENAHKIFAEDVDILYPRAIATTWSISRPMLSPQADALFTLMAFFAAEPIAIELLLQSRELTAPVKALQDALESRHEFRIAARQLARFSLARIDDTRNVIKIHRVVQAVTRGQLMRTDPETARRFKTMVHSLLAASDPNAPDQDDSEEAYELSHHHITASGALESSDPTVRRLIINQVRRLCRRSRFFASLNLGETALRKWQEIFGSDDRQTLALAVEVGPSLRGIGRWEEAQRLNDDTLRRLRKLNDTESHVYLACARSRDVDLSILGHYAEALENDLRLLPLHEHMLGRDHLETLELHSNIAIGMRCLGRFDEARKLDQDVFEQRKRLLGPTDTATLISGCAIARNLRMLGSSLVALDLIRNVCESLEEKGEPWNYFRLLAAADLGVSLRRAGYYQDAAAQGEMVLQTYLAAFGETHRDTLRASINIINDRRMMTDLAGAQELGQRTVARWEEVAGAGHPNTVAARASLAIVLRFHGNPKAACDLDEHALEAFIRVLGEEHPSSLIVMTNLASDLAAIGEVWRARELGERSLELHRQIRGTNHPFTLATAANLSVDRRATGDATGAAELHTETVARYNDTLSAEHPDSRLAAEHARLTIDIEPMTA
jgi:tetratricopeptide (TPR) repeat protein